VIQKINILARVNIDITKILGTENFSKGVSSLIVSRISLIAKPQKTL